MWRIPKKSKEQLNKLPTIKEDAILGFKPKHIPYVDPKRGAAPEAPLDHARTETDIKHRAHHKVIWELTRSLGFSYNLFDTFGYSPVLFTFFILRPFLKVYANS